MGNAGLARYTIALEGAIVEAITAQKNVGEK